MMQLSSANVSTKYNGYIQVVSNIASLRASTAKFDHFFIISHLVVNLYQYSCTFKFITLPAMCYSICMFEYSHKKAKKDSVNLSKS